MKVWFTSDTHFGAHRTLTLSKRPFETVEDMDNTLISNFNKLVGVDDIVYHLGDFGNYDVVKKLNGHIHLIFGNYEIHDLENIYENDIDKFKKHLLDLGFANISSDYNYFGNMMMAHKPKDIYDKSGKTFNLFGHIHGRCLVKKFGLDVGVDGHHFRPIDEETVQFFKNAVEKGYYDDNVWCGMWESQPTTLESLTEQTLHNPIITNPTITKLEWYFSPDGICNAMVYLKNEAMAFRGRSEMLVVKDDSVFLTINPDGTYKIPGGTWEKGESYINTAIRETQEEVCINTTKVKEYETYAEYKEPAKWVKEKIPQDHWWYGYYTKVFVGTYNGKYRGHIEESDKDDQVKHGKFYKIDNVISSLKPVHQRALNQYLNNGQNIV